MAFMSRAAHVLQWREQRDANLRGGANPKKHAPVQIERLQLAFVKLESLVIAGQQHCGECVPEPCTLFKGAWQFIRLGGANPPS